MSRLFNAVKAGVRGAMSAMGPGKYAAGGVAISCAHCKQSEFVKREAQFNTAGMTFLDLDWMNRSGIALVCTTCGLIQWFAKDPDRIDESSSLTLLAEDSEPDNFSCRECGAAPRP